MAMRVGNVSHVNRQNRYNLLQCIPIHAIPSISMQKVSRRCLTHTCEGVHTIAKYNESHLIDFSAKEGPSFMKQKAPVGWAIILELRDSIRHRRIVPEGAVLYIFGPIGR